MTENWKYEWIHGVTWRTVRRWINNDTVQIEWWVGAAPVTVSDFTSLRPGFLHCSLLSCLSLSPHWRCEPGNFMFSLRCKDSEARWVSAGGGGGGGGAQTEPPPPPCTSNPFCAFLLFKTQKYSTYLNVKVPKSANCHFRKPETPKSLARFLDRNKSHGCGFIFLPFSLFFSTFLHSVCCCCDEHMCHCRVICGFEGVSASRPGWESDWTFKWMFSLYSTSEIFHPCPSRGGKSLSKQQQLLLLTVSWRELRPTAYFPHAG